MAILRPVSDPVQRALATAARLRECVSPGRDVDGKTLPPDPDYRLIVLEPALCETAKLAADELEAIAQYVRAIEAWKDEGEALLSEDPDTHSAFFMLGCWWADRPWRRR